MVVGGSCEQGVRLARREPPQACLTPVLAPEVFGPALGSYFGCGTIRRYGRGAFQPLGNAFLASSSLTAGTMITSSPCFQFTGVATLCLAVSWIESITRRTSS